MTLLHLPGASARISADTYRAAGSAVMCICNLTADEMFNQAGNMRDPCGAVLDCAAALECQCDRLIVATNNAGSGCGSYDTGTRALKGNCRAET